MNEPKLESSQIDDIKNVGLVILHPFLQQLFENLNWCKGTNWNGQRGWNKAVLATQYLVTGKQEYDSIDLTVNKILCGFISSYQIDPAILLTNDEVDECRTLLTAVISHWKILKDCSIESFQELFLQRNGKVLLTNGQTQLWLEKSAVDILFGSLPWSIDIIKTPWMSEPLWCYW